jgi:hypothetical protein
MVDAMKSARDKQHEEFMDQLGTKLAKEMGPVKFFGLDPENDPVLQVANEVFRKAARRKVN